MLTYNLKRRNQNKYIHICVSVFLYLSKQIYIYLYNKYTYLYIINQNLTKITQGRKKGQNGEDREKVDFSEYTLFCSYKLEAM